MKQTAVEWLQNIWMNEPLWSYEKIQQWFEQAKEMERQQHGKTWDTALDKSEARAGNYMRAYGDFDDYFAETYGSKGSDETKTNKFMNYNKINEAGFNEATVFGPSENNPPNLGKFFTA